jgi:hypothetical protein
MKNGEEKKSEKKRKITLELCDCNTEYKGRLLGLIDDSEFYRLINSRRLQTNVFSSVTKPLSEIAEHAAFDGLRLVMAIREINDESIGGKHLLVTEKLDMTVHVESPHRVGLLDEKGQYILILEEME